MIKLTIGDYEVTVNAKDLSLGDTRNNKKATENFLNELTIFLNAGLVSGSVLEKRSQKMADDIYGALSTLGVYEHIA